MEDASPQTAIPLPLWVDALKSRVTRMPEYKALSGALYNEVRKSVRADGLQSFGELGPTERQVLVARSRTALDESEAFKTFQEAAFRAVDTALDDAAEDVLSHRAGSSGGLRGISTAQNFMREASSGVQETGGKVGAIIDLT